MPDALLLWFGIINFYLLKINILSSRFPYPLEKGDKLRLFHQIRLLSVAHEIHLFSISEYEVPEEDLSQLRFYCKSIHVYKVSRARRVVNVLKGMLRGMPIHVSYFFDQATAKKITREMMDNKAELTYYQLIRVVPYVHPVEGRRWLDFMDSFSGNIKRRIEYSGWLEQLWLQWELERLRRFERESLDKSDIRSVISVQDRREIDPEDGHHIAVLPNGVDTDYYVPNVYSNREYDICFTGNLGYEPNIRAARFIMDHISSGLNSDYTYRIAGARLPRSLGRRSDSQYIITGWVDDMREVYWSARLFVAPLFTGSGQQNKILEAMACGLPVITTTLVNNAIGAVDGEEILIADDAAQFIETIENALNDEALLSRLSENGRRFIEQRYTWAAIGKVMEEMLLSR